MNSFMGMKAFLFFRRLVIEYCIIYEYITTAFFIWSLLTICSSLLMIQTILVEYLAVYDFYL